MIIWFGFRSFNWSSLSSSTLLSLSLWLYCHKQTNEQTKYETNTNLYTQFDKKHLMDHPFWIKFRLYFLLTYRFDVQLQLNISAKKCLDFFCIFFQLFVFLLSWLRIVVERKQVNERVWKLRRFYWEREIWIEQQERLAAKTAREFSYRNMKQVFLLIIADVSIGHTPWIHHLHYYQHSSL